MNKKVTVLLVMIAVLALVTLAVIYYPSLIELMLRMHSIPQH
jgi:uncharacterized protein YybS (DUF2232 family)